MNFIGLLFLLLSTPLWAGWTVSTYNIRNFDKDRSGRTDYVELSRQILAMKGDVMAFQEVVNVEAFNGLMSKVLPGYAVRFSSCGGFGKQRLAVVYNPRTFKFVSEDEDLTFSGPSNSCGPLRPVFFVTLTHKATKEDYVLVWST